jgi:hypothetical protein
VDVAKLKFLSTAEVDKIYYATYARVGIVNKYIKLLLLRNIQLTLIQRYNCSMNGGIRYTRPIGTESERYVENAPAKKEPLTMQ